MPDANVSRQIGIPRRHRHTRDATPLRKPHCLARPVLTLPEPPEHFADQVNWLVDQEVGLHSNRVRLNIKKQLIQQTFGQGEQRLLGLGRLFGET